MALLIIFAAALGFLVPSISLEILGVEEYLLNVDTSINPCEDFYKFACGKYASNNPIPEDKLVVSEATKVQDLIDSRLIEALNESIQENEAKSFQNLKKYYHSCTNIDRIEEIGLNNLKEILGTLGGWPVVADLNPDENWESVLYGLLKKYLEANALISLKVREDFKNSTARILVISPADTISQALIKKFAKTKAYYDLMVQTAKAFGAKQKIAEHDMGLVLEFEIYLANNMKSPEEVSADADALYNLKTIEQLEMEFPGFRWRDYMQILFSKPLNSNTKIILTEPEYTKSLIEILRDTPTRVIRNYIIWKAIENILPLLNKEVRDLNSKYNEVLTGTTSRSEECLAQISLVFPIIKNALYIRKYFDKFDRNKANDIANLIKNQFEQTLDNSNWTEQDKANAIEKIKSVKLQVGFPDELLHDEKLDSHYKTLQIDDDNFLQNTLNLREFQTNYEFSRLALPVNKTDWIDFAQHSADVNAFYNREANAIFIPAGILQGTFFNPELPQSIQFGTIGQVIAHEISHAFDNKGRKFNKDGIPGQWWSEVAEQDFAEKNRCLVEQFNNFTLLGKKINGNRTLGENIADLGGLMISYLSYQTWWSQHNEVPLLPDVNYTNNQLFWIASAGVSCSNEKEEYTKNRIATNIHSPNEFRINGPLRNLDMFSKDFNCSLCSNMNPENKCTPW